MNTKCHFCGNKNFKETKVQYIYKHNGKFLIMDDVPCEQCEFCGEQYFEGKILRQIETEFNNIYVQGKKPIKELHVPIESFSAVQYA
ncbi:YgiT-type zinc finger protein [Candidatus Marithrix sp. Canyon 246]|uniref:YgiT-type zinc finger protein n=1 Tax=Candidatus Marithrix sp. Canyon 246 TaxID=1827136 RepID=UPI00084A20A2|nr:YgiT-type zinc finger protein [Candidatus Marithrix sp. Canyon 246]